MTELEKGKPVSLQELMLANLAQTDALTKLLIEKGIITDAEFKQKLLEERSFSRSHGCQLARIEGSRCRYLDHWRRNSNRLWNPFFYG
jgi:hypothetical protein